MGALVSSALKAPSHWKGIRSMRPVLMVRAAAYAFRIGRLHCGRAL